MNATNNIVWWIGWILFIFVWIKIMVNDLKKTDEEINQEREEQIKSEGGYRGQFN